ncbi:MAG TPA: hypothetical protein VFR40_00565, partial [Lapillicoccus sp.]|nr:hypothetical protein [Lapillicoccus sp.]
MSVREFDEGTEAVAAVMATPIGRRWILKAGLGGAAAAVLGTAAATSAQAGPSAPTASGGGPQDRIVFQFALGAAAKLGDLRIVANGKRVPLTPHTAASRKKLRNQGTLFGKINTGVLTHYADLRLPRDLGLVMLVSGTRSGETVVVATHVYAPVQGIRQVALAANKLDRSYRLVAGSPIRTQMLGLDPGSLKNWQEVADLDAIVDSQQSAVGLVFCHPNIANKEPVHLTTTKFLLAQTSEVQTLGSYLDTMTNNGVAYATQPTMTNRDGTPAQFRIGGKLTTAQTTQLNTTDSTFRSNLTSGIVAGTHSVRNAPTLGEVVDQPLDVIKDPKDTSTWHTYEGSVPPVTNYTGPSVGASGVVATVSRPGFIYGTKAEISSPFSNGGLQMTFYNNFVRWVTVYVQYLDVKGNNLSHITSGPAPTWPTTTYAEGVGLLPQVFTLLGIPLFNTNTLSKTLQFPPNAVAANILYCGLGNDSADGGWEQYFEGAYPAGQMAPKNEVLVPALITGILSIGVTAFALCIDLDISTTWRQLSKITDDNIEAFEGLLTSLLADAPWATAAEVFGMTAAAGAASYADVSANGGAQNLWSVIAGALASMIPKILFNPATNIFWVEVAAVIFSGELLQDAIDAIPFVGLALGIISAAGDAITLAEAIGESAASPWVIGNKITLSYPVTVTVGYDNVHAATWPETAASWTLQSSIDGTTVGQPITGLMNVG